MADDRSLTDPLGPTKRIDAPLDAAFESSPHAGDAPPPSVHGPETSTVALGTRAPSLPAQDLSGDKLILSARRLSVNGRDVPSLGGIPLFAKLGQGGMGAVYYGLHPKLEIEVAVKVLPFHLAEHEPGLIDRFFREARIAAHIKSPHLIAVFDADKENDLSYLVMEYVPGTSAGGYLRSVKQSGLKGLSELEALEICIAATAGLSAAHSAGIVHRDIKPDNILIPKDGVGMLDFSRSKLADLGLARTEASGQSMTGSGACMGTPGYMAPEQAEDAKRAGQPADVFSMGATLYALLSGAAPFGGSALMKVLRDTIEQPHAPIRDLRPEISPATVELVNRCLAKTAAGRFAGGAALLEALRICKASLGKSPSQQAAAADQVAAMIMTTQETRHSPAAATVARADGPKFLQDAPAEPTAAPATMRSQKSAAGWLAVAAVVAAVGGGALLYIDHRRDAAEREKQTLAEKPETKPVTEAPKLPPANDVAPPPQVLERPEPKKPADDSRERVKEERRRVVEEAKLNFNAAMTAALDAKIRGDWAAVLTALRQPLDGLDGQAHPNRARGEELIREARRELQRQGEFNAALKDARALRADGRLEEAEKGFAAALAIWPDGPQAAGLKKDIDEIASVRAATALEKKKAEDAAREKARLEQVQAQYQDAMKAAHAALDGERPSDGFYWRMDEAKRTAVERALDRALAARSNDADALAMKAKLRLPAVLTLDLGKGVQLNAALLKGGTFVMGTAGIEREHQQGERPQHEVELSQPFFMGIHEVTQEQYEAVMGVNPSVWIGARQPVDSVTWSDAAAFCEKLSARSGRIVRLPTEAEWEYACRAGTTTQYSIGDLLRPETANYDAAFGAMAGGGGPGGGGRGGGGGGGPRGGGAPPPPPPGGNAPPGPPDPRGPGIVRGRTATVGSYPANPFGLFDMHGNVWEFCQDWYDEGYYAVSPRIDPTGPATGTVKVIRGGAWNVEPTYCRSALRRRVKPDGKEGKHPAYGFRIVVALSKAP